MVSAAVRDGVSAVCVCEIMSCAGGREKNSMACCCIYLSVRGATVERMYIRWGEGMYTHKNIKAPVLLRVCHAPSARHVVSLGQVRHLCLYAQGRAGRKEKTKARVCTDNKKKKGKG